jgi:hypothetical protein
MELDLPLDWTERPRLLASGNLRRIEMGQG